MSDSRRFRSMVFKSMVFGLSLALLAGSASAAIEKRQSFNTDRLVVRNLIGEVRVEAGSGSDFDVQVTIDGKDAREGLIELSTTGDSLEIRFPEGQTDYVYPRMGRGSNTSFSDDGGSGGWLSSLIRGMTGKGRVRVRGSGSGMELWADVVVRVPNGSALEVEHGVGRVVANGVNGELELSTRSGDVVTENTSGRLAVATGSGDVEVVRVTGGRVEVATGSGDVDIEDCDGDRIQVATGSGDVDVTAMRGRELQVATGSGDVEAREISADDASIATGSGQVRLAMDQMGSGEFSLATGSGDIELALPSGVSAEVHAETDGGEIRVDLEGDVQYSRREEDEVRLTVGSGGASVDLGTGSGDIRIGN